MLTSISTDQLSIRINCLPYSVNSLKLKNNHSSSVLSFVVCVFNAKNRQWNCQANSLRRFSLHNFISHNQFSFHSPNIPNYTLTNLYVVKFIITKNLPLPITIRDKWYKIRLPPPTSFKIDLINPNFSLPFRIS